MSQPLRVLLVEDSEDDALLLLRALQQDGFAPTHARVETAEAMCAELARQPWDIILADHRMPRFSAPAALRVLLDSGLDIPFIVVSAVMPEETALELMRSGARDFVPKQNPARLLPAVRRELSQAEARRRAREATEIQARLAAIVEWSEDAILAIDLEGRVTDWNAGAERLYGYAAAEVIGRCVSSVVPADRAGDLPGILARVSRGEHVPAHDTVRVRKDGSRVDVAMTASPIRDEAGRVTRVSWIARDITERKRAEAERLRLLDAEREARAQAEEASHAKDEFLALVSHELRNPLSAITSGMHLLRLHCPSEGRAGRALEIVERNAVLQTRMVNDLLDLSRLQRGKLTLQRAPVDLAKVVEGPCHSAEAQARDAGLTLTCDATRDLWVYGDLDRLQQVVMNLLTNAIRFTPPPGEVRVAVLECGGDGVRGRLIGGGFLGSAQPDAAGATPATSTVLGHGSGVSLP